MARSEVHDDRAVTGQLVRSWRRRREASLEDNNPALFTKPSGSGGGPGPAGPTTHNDQTSSRHTTGTEPLALKKVTTGRVEVPDSWGSLHPSPARCRYA